MEPMYQFDTQLNLFALANDHSVPTETGLIHQSWPCAGAYSNQYLVVIEMSDLVAGGGGDGGGGSDDMHHQRRY